MSATIITFPVVPRPAPRRAVLCDEPAPPISATALARKFEDHFLPVVWASVDLLEADEQEFDAR